MKIDIYSYSIKYREELPVKSPNFIFDCRGVKNPGRVATLKALTGLDQQVIEFLNTEPSAIEFMNGLNNVLIKTLPAFLSKKYTDKMSICFCCTGGRHRSVYFSELVTQKIRLMQGIQVQVSHLDIEKKYF